MISQWKHFRDNMNSLMNIQRGFIIAELNDAIVVVVFVFALCTLHVRCSSARRDQRTHPTIQSPPRESKKRNRKHEN